MPETTVLVPSAFPAPTLRRESGPILVAVKPAEGHEATLEMAQWLAQGAGRELQVVSVVEAIDASAAAAGAPLLPVEHNVAERGEVAKALRARLGDGAPEGTPIRVDVLEGPTAMSIANLGRDRGASVIVVGTGRHGVLGRFLYGERALDVIRQSVRPVLVVPPTLQVPVRRAVIAVDFTQASLRAASVALDVLAEGGRLTLLHVENALRLDEPSIGWFEEAYEQRAREMLGRFRAALPPAPSVTIDLELLRGDTVTTLLAYAEREGAQLIGCGRLRHPLVERLLVGSVSTALVRRSPCAVLVAPERPYDEELDEGHWLTGVTVTSDHEEWAGCLRRFTERNAGRAVQLQLEHDMGGLESTERGYILLGVDYDRRNERADVMLGDPITMGNHVTHSIARLQSVELSTDRAGKDAKLTLDAAGGRCTLTFAR